jgi:hypothetical protein
MGYITRLEEVITDRVLDRSVRASIVNHYRTTAHSSSTFDMPISSRILVASLTALALSVGSEAYTVSPVLTLTNSRNHTCGLQPKITSCENTTAVTADTCCTVNSLSLVTQFWSIVSFVKHSFPRRLAHLSFFFLFLRLTVYRPGEQRTSSAQKLMVRSWALARFLRRYLPSILRFEPTVSDL